MKNLCSKHILVLPMFRHILFICLCLCVDTAFAYSVKINKIYYDLYNSYTANVTYQKQNADNTYTSDYSGTVVIPEYIYYNGDMYIVDGIGSDAFYGCTGLTSITIPNSVTSIGNSAFYGCTGLTSITIPNSVTSIGWHAFSGCSRLTTISFPNSETSIDYAFDNTAWYNNQPEGLVYAGKLAYRYKGTMPSGSHITLKEGTLGIVSDAFSNCTGLTSVTIPNSVTSIGNYAFKGCSDLTSVTIPNSVTSIGWNAFYGCTGLKSVSIGNNVRRIEDATFYGCSGLTSITIPSSVTNIDNYAFYGCSGLKSISIGNSVKSIGSSAFSDCTNIKSIYCHTSNPPTLYYDSFSVFTKDNILYVPRGSQELYSNAHHWYKFSIVELDYVESIELGKSRYDIIVGESIPVEVSFTPTYATCQDLYWHIYDSGVAVVENGVVTGLKTGTTTLTVTTTDGTNLSASCIINVINPVISLTLDRTCAELLVEQQITLNASCSPANADNQKVSWTTSNGEIATVSQDGIVTAMGEGDVAIIATTTDGTKLSASCQVHVKRHKQSIIWNQEALTCQEGGEMIVLEAESSSGLPVTFSSSDPDVLSIFDLGDVVYANPVKQGKAFVSVYQQGNYKYEPAEQAKEIEVLGKTVEGYRTLVAYYSQSKLIDGIVTELTNQIAGANIQVYTQKIESSNSRIDEANHNADVRDSIMNVITLYPDDAESYPSIKPLSASVSDYDAVILVYPIWNAAMAAPMQTFCFQNREILESKSVAYIEYDLFDEAGTSSNAQVLRLSPSNIADKKDLIKEWLDNSVATGILQFRHDKKESRDGIYDLQGRKLYEVPSYGIYVEKGLKKNK